MRIIEALKNGDRDNIKAAIEAEGVTIKDEYGNSPIHYAAISGNVDAIDLLVAAGALVDELNNLKETALMKAVSHQRTEAARKLLDSKANPNIQDIEGYTSVHRAALNNDLSLIEMLNKYEGKLDITTKDGDTVMHCAALGWVEDSSKDWALIDWLLSKNADYNLENTYSIKPEDTFNKEDLSYGEIFQEHVREILGDTESH